jgi:shikimate dehydrogenase
MNITPKTGLCGVILHPAGHTLSPAMHNAAYEKMGLNSVYLAFDVVNVEYALAGMRSLGIRQFSVSVPHKVEVMEYLDEIDPAAKAVGAVNTVINKDGRLIGYNTDVDGVRMSFTENGVEIKGRKVLLLGAGGAARAIAFVVKDMGGELIILNRTLPKAKALAEEFGGRWGGLQEGSGIEADVVVNSTSVGMYPKVDETPIGKDGLKPGMVVFDIVYNPLKTRLLMEAEGAGCKTINGMNMLVYQGARQIELWTGLKPPVEVMKEAFLKGYSR